jgi:MFS family permease
VNAAAPRGIFCGIFYGWAIVLVGFVTMTLVMGTRFSFGVFYSGMLAEMGWSRAATAGIFSISMLVYAVVASGVGAAFDRWGPRGMFPWAAVLLGIGFFLCSRITALWQFYLYYGVLVGTGFTAIGFIPHVALVARWFVRRRGLATSLALAGTGVGSFLLAPVTEALIARYGWRASYMIYALLIPGLLVPLILWVHRSHPEDIGLHPDGALPVTSGTSQTIASIETLGTAPYLTALTSRGFWALFSVILAIGCNLMLLTVHQNQYLIDIGFSPVFAAWMLGLTGLLRSSGSVLWGALSDFMTREMSFTCATLLGVVALVCLLAAQTFPAAWLVILAVILMGLGYGGTSVIYSTAAADLFQGRHFGKILGLMEIGFGLGGSLGSALAGVVFDYFHTYRPAFYITIGLMLASIAGIWIAAPRAARRPVEARAQAQTPPLAPLKKNTPD